MYIHKCELMYAQEKYKFSLVAWIAREKKKYKNNINSANCTNRFLQQVLSYKY